MNHFDKKIRQMAENTPCPTSKEYEKKIDRTLEAIKNQSPAVTSRKASFFSFPKAGIAVCGAAALVLISIPVSAKISDYVKDRMEQMSSAEQEQYITANDSSKMTKEHDTEALRYSRELTADEENRYRALWDKYRNEGLFPEGELTLTDRLEADAAITAPVYETYNREIFLPDRALTDEELLQMIDFSEKSAYAVSQTKEAQESIQAQQEFNRNPYPDETDLSEDEAISKAITFFHEMYGVDCSQMETSCDYWMGFGFGEYGDYEITFKESDTCSYCVNINSATGILSQLFIIKDGIDYHAPFRTPAKADETFLRSNYENAKKLITSAFNSDVTVTKATCGYSVNANGETETGCAYYFFGLSNNTVYGIQYHIDSDYFGYIYQLSDQGWEQGGTPEPGFQILELEP
ncbi:MAG: hypothetical protein K2H52_10720 [Lachnospiraceae bacterium]|nr:hypothetical protein [Lachnospiraceae bacterium]MDE6184047.1 hypothetical protein [Lachnospiraceae bacterium]